MGYDSRSKNDPPEKRARELFDSIEEDLQENIFRCDEIKPMIDSLPSTSMVRSRGKDLLKKCAAAKAAYKSTNRGTSGNPSMAIAIVAVVVIAILGSTALFSLKKDASDENIQFQNEGTDTRRNKLSLLSYAHNFENAWQFPEN